MPYIWCRPLVSLHPCKHSLPLEPDARNMESWKQRASPSQSSGPPMKLQASCGRTIAQKGLARTMHAHTHTKRSERLVPWGFSLWAFLLSRRMLTDDAACLLSHCVCVTYCYVPTTPSSSQKAAYISSHPSGGAISVKGSNEKGEKGST